METALDPNPDTATTPRGGKFLTFRLANEEYGIEILKAREIIGLMDITQVPRTPEFVRGVINLRGKIIPVIDLRLRFGMPTVPDTDETCIIVVDVETQDIQTQISVVVDSVCEVIDVADSNIEPAPDLGDGESNDFIQAIAKLTQSIVILLEIDKVADANASYVTQACESNSASLTKSDAAA